MANTNVQLWDLRSGQPLSPPIVVGDYPSHAASSADGQRLYLAVGTNLLTWDSRSCQPIQPPVPFPNKLNYFAFDPDERRYVTCLSDSTWSNLWAQVWDAKTRRPISPRLRHDDGVLYAAFSPDGQKLATCGEDFTARIWDISSGTLLAEPLQHNHQVHMVDFSKDGRWLLTASWDRTARLWDVETGEPISPPLRNPTILNCGGFLEGAYHFRVAASGDSASSSWEWTLAKDARSIEDWQDLAFLFSPSVSRARQIAPEDTAETIHRLKATWERLKSKDPTLFATTAADVRAWHEREAAAAEKANDAYAAEFHANRLLRLDPTNEHFKARLRRARTQPASAAE